ncbi:uncharacterized membrane protein (UPF0136 family) [Alkalihalobacillus xiaoxiensis]|uniref:Uncharacterized membrane protein (UPF0136 family) n=1 Tax=Shouchella xiaoxiensis TaxID=766895 RepID=A0ABS2SX83_9BACI|nr:hypothetical protein [Shouchella xiaoxiensis]MBM7839370.1 uncharacterized membrane protein (UPF0136 family) [Shouchella xiaoxiensis]
MSLARKQILPIGAFLLFLLSLATGIVPLFYVALVFMTIAVGLNVTRLVKQRKFVLAILAVVIFIAAIYYAVTLSFFGF